MEYTRCLNVRHMLVLVLVFTDVYVCGVSLEKDLETLSEILPGVYSNAKQYVTEAGQKIEPARGHMLMKTVIRPVDVSFLGHSFNVFVEQYSGSDNIPYRQRLESFSVDENQRAIRLRVFTFTDNSLLPKLARDLSTFKTLNETNLVTQKGCDLFWRKLRKKTFVGATGRGCLGSVRREPVRISVSTTLTSKMLTTHEGWYKVKDGSKVMEIELPYNLIKIKKFTGNRYVPRSELTPVRTSRHLSKIQNDLPIEKSSYRRRKHRKSHSGKKSTKAKSYVSTIPTYNSAWTLSSFRGLQDALTSGRAVYFIAELSGCMLPPQAKIERTSFGDAVDVFEHVVQRRGRKREFIRFSQKKAHQSSRGFETSVREITVFRNGKVIVRLRTMKPDRVPISYAANCRLFNYDEKTGDIKFSTDPFKNIKRIKTFGFLRSSLKKGRRVRMTVDFSKCSGSAQNTVTEIGGEIRGYDFLNGGKVIEFSLARPDIDMSRNGVSQRFLIGRVLQNGDVIFIDMSDEHSNSVDQNQQHFRCSLKGNDALPKPGEKAVKLFYL